MMSVLPLTNKTIIFSSLVKVVYNVFAQGRYINDLDHQIWDRYQDCEYDHMDLFYLYLHLLVHGLEYNYQVGICCDILQ